MKGHIRTMLDGQKKHLSFHTPGHKKKGADITELSYSDNLSAPHGVLARAEIDVGKILGANRSFLLTDGSTCGVHAMLYALKKSGATSVAYADVSHVSVKNGCILSGLESVVLSTKTKDGIPQPPTLDEMEKGLKRADALLLTSPDYYGNFPDLEGARAICQREGKPLLVDGAHGSHLHGTKLHAGEYASMWVDGVHKSLPALTQGAVVSAKTEKWSLLLEESVLLFRTTSPSYPIMASVEEAVKYPKNERLEEAAKRLKQRLCAYPNKDWTKIVVPFGDFSDVAQNYLEQKGIYCEFNDGNYLMFYLSPCTKMRWLKRLEKELSRLPRTTVQDGAHANGEKSGRTQWIPLADAVGKTCAKDAGRFPPCLPLVKEGEKITKDSVKALQTAGHTFGLKEGKISVYE